MILLFNNFSTKKYLFGINDKKSSIKKSEESDKQQQIVQMNQKLIESIDDMKTTVNNLKETIEMVKQLTPLNTVSFKISIFFLQGNFQ